ncbi:hypothetical protein Tco_0919089 [Tanacetum coccineum]
MDFKGIAWVGNIYQKFEAMCLEVEEAMSQETAKYVENQVQTVGASMKKFCSDVMQDMVPPSSKDLSRVASAELSLNPYLEFGVHKVKRPISSFKKVAIDNMRVKGITEDKCVKGIPEDKSNSSNDVWEDWSAASINWEISDNDEENCERMTMQAASEATTGESKGEQEGKIFNTIVGTSPTSPASGTTVSTKTIAKDGKRSRCISSSNVFRARPTDTCENSGLDSQTSLQATSNTSSCQSLDGVVSRTESSDNTRQVSPSQTGSYVSSNAQCCQSIDDEVIRPQTDSIGSTEDHNENDTTVQMMEPTGHEPESGFEETCVLVDGNDYRPDNHEEAKRRSYKKKIQNVFSLKKKSSRKHEYKQLAAQFSNANAEPNVQGVENESHALTLSEDKKAQKLVTNDSLESEWELL